MSRKGVWYFCPTEQNAVTVEYVQSMYLYVYLELWHDTDPTGTLMGNTFVACLWFHFEWPDFFFFLNFLFYSIIKLFGEIWLLDLGMTFIFPYKRWHF